MPSLGPNFWRCYSTVELQGLSPKKRQQKSGGISMLGFHETLAPQQACGGSVITSIY